MKWSIIHLLAFLAFLATYIHAAPVGTEAAAPKPVAERYIEDQCSDFQRAQIQTAQGQCVKLALRAAKAAYEDSRFPAYFHSDSSDIRAKVASRFHAIAKECTKPRLGYHCSCEPDQCKPGEVAFYTSEDDFGVTFCQSFYGMPLVNPKPTGQGGDRGTVILHELTHSPVIYHPGTHDLEYGFHNTTERVKTTEAALDNADSFVLFAQDALYNSYSLNGQVVDCFPDQYLCHAIGVQLSAAGNSAVKVVVTNNGDMALNLLRTATLFDEKLPVERISMFASNSSIKVPFEGISRVHLDTDNLSTDDFLVLGAGAKKELTIEAASLHDLSNGGSFDVFANGMLQYANTNSTELVGHLEYTSNKLSITVNGTEAATHKPVAERWADPYFCRRFIAFMNDQIAEAQKNCQKLALGAAAAARAGHRHLETFFHSRTQATKDAVSARYTAIAQECANPSASLNLYCHDRIGNCNGNLAYYARLGLGITFCADYWDLPAVAKGQCSAKDQGTVLLHEMTHSSEVYSPGTKDWAYDYWPSVKLSSRKALNNADSFKLFANHVRWGC
ncbi:uncharacterized protein J4E78_009391 [Alternaria triticimaculans]|uniref:uncharacterized protein n=1 Tax=Alternaria triticimaculans TaxID=297637 RepID=UPI0020C41E41|nr:uncharacterized protein J4E78_009391 [Alternaria triticimaculans]KAI4645479.1 hypothetical protein J4E78_009391 [Alternaria triticimaculans]